MQMIDETAECTSSEQTVVLFPRPIEDDVVAWLEYRRIIERVVRDYLSPNRGHQYQFPTSQKRSYLHATEYACVLTDVLSGVQNVPSHVQAFYTYFSRSVRLDE